MAADFYNRYETDLDLARGLGLTDFRFSAAWSRVLPEGLGAVNRRGLDYYDRLVDACLERDLRPWLTLYHWDLPSALQARGGLPNGGRVAAPRQGTQYLGRFYAPQRHHSAQ